MIHPIFKTALKRPDLVIRHLANYSELIRCEAVDVGKGLVVQAGAAALALISLLLALGLTGVAVMLGLVYDRFHWALVAVPALAWLSALIGGVLARRSNLRQDIKDVQEEVELDVEGLRLAKAVNDE